MNSLINYCELVGSLLREKNIYECALGRGFFYADKIKYDVTVFRAMPCEYLGFFLPFEYEKDAKTFAENTELWVDDERISLGEAKGYKLHQLQKGFNYQIDFHDESLLSAVNFAAFHHKFQRRKYDGSPYIGHLLEVCQLVRIVGGVEDINILKAAILHDVVEDTHVHLDSIFLFFGQNVALKVSELTCTEAESTVEKREKLLNQLEYASQESKLIKLADLSSNISSIPSWPEKQIAEYINWCEKVASICKPASPALYEYFKHSLNCSSVITKEN